MIDFDFMFYRYVCEMGMSEPDFWKSPLRKVVKLLDIHMDAAKFQESALNGEEYQSKYFSEKTEVTEIHSMREMEGFVDA